MMSFIYAYCCKLGLYAECHYAKCRYAECRYAECGGASVCAWTTFGEATQL